MSVGFLIGRAGTGKTEACLQQVAEALRDLDPTQPVEQQSRPILLVPEQASLQMEAALIARLPTHGFAGGVVYSFTTLAKRILADAGFRGEFIGETVRLMGLRALLQRDDLRAAFGKAVETRGFLREAQRSLREFIQDGISAAQLRAAAEKLDDVGDQRRVAALADLFGEYVSWLGDERFDGAAEIGVAADVAADISWLQNARLWVDGFAGFTAVEAKLLLAVTNAAQDAHVTLLADPDAPSLRDAAIVPDPLDPFYGTLTTYRTLVSQLASQGIAHSNVAMSVPHRFAGATALATLERRLSEGPDARIDEVENQATTEHLQFRACETHREEIRVAAREILQSVAQRNGDLNFSDFALITRDLEPFSNLVSEVLDEYEIPYFIDLRRTLAGHPLTRLMCSLFAAVRNDLRVDDMRVMIETELLPLDREQGELLANYIAANAIRGAGCWSKTASWDFADEPWLASPRRRKGVDETILRGLNDARAMIFLGLDTLLGPAKVRAALTGTEWSKRTIDALLHLRVREKLGAWIAEAYARNDTIAAETHEAAWVALCEALDALHTLFSESPLDIDTVTDLVCDTLANRTFGVAPPRHNQVMVSAIERSRHPSLRRVFLFGFNEGVFPAAPAQPTLLGWEVRAALAANGLANLSQREDDINGEYLLAYIAMTRASEKLTISYAKLSADGKELPPSRLLSEIATPCHVIQAEDFDLAQLPLTLRDVGRGYFDERRIANDRPSPHFRSLRAALVRNPEFADELREIFAGTEISNAEPSVGNFRVGREGADAAVWHTSPGEVESYLSCPFQHFAKFGLSLKTPQRADDFSRDLGSAAHEIMARVVIAARDDERGLRALCMEDWQEWVKREFAAMRARFPHDFGDRKPRFALMLELLEQSVRACAVAQGERYRRGHFQPVDVELRFGEQRGDLNARIELPNGDVVMMKGAIDRIDAAKIGDESVFLICDYKSAAKWPRNGPTIDVPLQVLLYSWIRLASLPASARFTGALIVPLYPDESPIQNKYYEEAPEVDRQLYLLRPRGVLEESIVPLLDPHLEPGGRQSPVIGAKLNMLQKGQQKAAFDRHSDVVDRARLAEFREHAREALTIAAKGIAEGRVQVSPLRIGNALVCAHCDYLSVCRFEKGQDPIRPAELVLPVLQMRDPKPKGDK